jgi:hypothetical protein
MKHSPHARTSAELSDSVHRRLTMYALAASAAGVGVLALVEPAEAKVIYTPLSVKIDMGATYRLGGVTDLTFVSSRHPCSTACGASSVNVIEGRRNWVEGWISASALPYGAKVGPGRKFYGRLMCLSIVSDNGGRTQGAWCRAADGYLGLSFKIHGKTHYGWARLTRAFDMFLTGFAYETDPNTPITTGKTKGPDVITVQPAGLGHLAAGASPLRAWRPGK